MAVQSLFSLIALGQLTLLTLWLVVRCRDMPVYGITIALLASVTGYLIVSNEALEHWLGSARPLFLLLALFPPYLLWLFAIDLFEIAWLKHRARYLILLIPVGVFAASFVSEDTRMSLTLHQGISLLIVAQIVTATYLEHHDDLVNQRRSFRFWFVGLVSVQTTAILIVELLYAGEAIPDGLEVLNVLAISLLIVCLSLPLIRPELELFQQPGPGKSAQASDDDSGDSPSALIEQLLKLMAEGFFKTSGLTIKQLADRLGTGEHQLRATINQQLGYRNFNAFLNKYRIEAAQANLRDPSLNQTPILTIALELGYQSIGPFNRAFKAETGMTPSQFRNSAVN